MAFLILMGVLALCITDLIFKCYISVEGTFSEEGHIVVLLDTICTVILICISLYYTYTAIK